MATINEISKKANVSIATVSKVLNGKKGVSKDTIEKVMNIAKELNYRPNLTARSLKNGQSRTIGVITEDLTVFNAPEIVDGIDAYCENNDYHYILGNLRFNKRFGNNINNKDCVELVHSQMDTMLSKQVDGIIYIGYHSRAIAPISDEVPFVYTYCYSTDPNIPSVLYDDQKAAYEATQLLINRGHRNIGVIAGQAGSMHAANRMLGYQEALFTNNIPYNPNLTLYGDWERDKGYELSEKLIEKGVTAIFAHNDIMATGVIEYCNKHGIQVGKDLALIGFDNREIGIVSRPTLSTVSLPLFEMGQAATKLLLDKLAGQPVQYGQKLMLACSLIERESTLSEIL
ncbi:MAG: LacI family transcriptional regulator [Clostridiaceae bacterium]|nr:LacI family transcriptional regulator [Clostridiaceae bacterium]